MYKRQVLVNTCGFIESAKTEAIENILEACSYKQANPELKVVVTGCLAERYRSQIAQEIPEVDAVVGLSLIHILFTVLPTVLVGGLDHLISLGRWPKVILEAVLKVGIFLSYMMAISHMKEIHRVFEYHGAEHKTIACYEAGDPLTVENVRKYTRFHPRCGTSFLILVVIVSVFLYSVLPWGSMGLRVLFKLLLLPVVMRCV